MNKSFRKTIPTIMGIILLLVGTASGIIILNAKQIFKLGAQEDSGPKNLKISNITDNSFTLSFTTNTEIRPLVKISEDKYFLVKTSIFRGDEKTKTHYYEIDGLNPVTNYYYNISINGTDYPADTPWNLTTANKISHDNSGRIVYGKVYSKSGEELGGAIVYVQCGSGSLISTLTSPDGSWAINLSKARAADLSEYMAIQDKNTLIQIHVQYADTNSSVLTYPNNINPLPPIIMGNALDLRNITPNVDIGNNPSGVFGTSTNYKNNPLNMLNIYKEK